MTAMSAAPAARGINRSCHCIGGATNTSQLNSYDATQQDNLIGARAAPNSLAAQQHYADGRQIKVHDSRGSHFQPQTSYVDHYPAKVLPHNPRQTNLGILNSSA